jgi:hypothetical protein
MTNKMTDSCPGPVRVRVDLWINYEPEQMLSRSQSIADLNIGYLEQAIQAAEKNSLSGVDSRVMARKKGIVAFFAMDPKIESRNYTLYITNWVDTSDADVLADIIQSLIADRGTTFSSIDLVVSPDSMYSQPDKIMPILKQKLEPYIVSRQVTLSKL